MIPPTPRLVSVVDENGYEYTGHVNEEHLPHGEGKLQYSSGQTYSGQFINGKPHGAPPKRAKCPDASHSKSSVGGQALGRAHGLREHGTMASGSNSSDTAQDYPRT